MLGFSRNDKRFIAALVRNHRRKIEGSVTQKMRQSEQSRYYKLLVLVRLATLFHRTRHANNTPPIDIKIAGTSIEIAIPDEWLQEHPLTCADIEDEIEKLNGIGFHLTLSSNCTF